MCWACKKPGGVFDAALFSPIHLLKTEEGFITTLQTREAPWAHVACLALGVNAVRNAHTNDEELMSNRTNLIMIFPHFLPSLVEYILM